MTTIESFIKRHPVLTYYALTFAISWGGILIVVGPGGIPGTREEFERLLPVVLLALLAGPSVAGLLLTGLVNGRADLRELLSRLLRWRVGVCWYSVALLTAPLLMMAIPLALSLLFPEFLPGILTTDDKASLLLMGIAAGLVGGFLEELGWTGFAIPRLRLRYGVPTTGLIVGVLWGAWHFPMNFWTSGDSSGAVSLALLLHSVLFSVGILPPYRVLMVWVYDRTGSLLVAMLMHLSLIASNVILVPLAIAGVTGPTWSLAMAAALWVVVAVVVVASGGQLSRQPPRRQKGRRIMANILKRQNGMSILGQGGKIILFMLPSLIAAILVDTYLPQIAALPEGISLVKPVGYLLLVPGVILWGTGVIQLLTAFSRGKLVTTGAYGVVRNPIYSSATFFILPAVALMTLTWVYFVPSVFLYVGVMMFIGAEEKQLTKAFGKEYEDYMARIDRLVPSKRP